ncbi:hypothetical protein JCM16303_001035 [Sporobolomyces ruberrimus]
MAVPQEQAPPVASLLSPASIEPASTSTTSLARSPSSHRKPPAPIEVDESTYVPPCSEGVPMAQVQQKPPAAPAFPVPQPQSHPEPVPFSQPSLVYVQPPQQPGISFNFPVVDPAILRGSSEVCRCYSCCAAITCILFWPLVCLPYLIPSLSDVEHDCARCGAMLAKYERKHHTTVVYHSYA